MSVLRVKVIVMVGFCDFVLSDVRKRAILVGILIFEVNSAPFRSIFAVLISGGMLGIDSV